MDCSHLGCKEERVGGQLYCDDHLLEMQVRVERARTQATTRSTGTMADLIRKAKGNGLIAPLITITEGSGYQKSA